jgi:predicted PurR-regulated permease PerM
MMEQRIIKLQSIAIPIISLMIMSVFLYYAKPILLPVLLGIAFAFILNPVVKLLMRLKLPRVAAVLIVVLTTLVLFLSIAALIASQASDLVTQFPQYWTGFQKQLSTWLDQFPSLAQYLPGDVSDGTINPLQDIKFKDITSISRYFFAGLGSAFAILWKTILVLLMTSFVLIEQEGFKDKLANLFGSEHRDTSRQIVNKISSNISGFMAVKFATTTALAVVVTIGLLIMGVPYAYVWGPLAGLLNLIPYIGAIMGAIPPMIVASIENQSMWWLMYVGIFFLILQFLEGNIITPKLVGDRININLTSVLIATVYWGWLWGGVGIILAMPITAGCKVICDHIEPLRPIGNLLEGGYRG